MNPAYMRLLALMGAVSSLPWLSEALSAASCSVDTFQSFLDANKILATVQTATSVGSNGTFTVPADEEAYTTSPTGLRALCAIQVNETSEAATHYTFGLFLPEDWNGRYLLAPHPVKVFETLALRYSTAPWETEDMRAASTGLIW